MTFPADDQTDEQTFIYVKFSRYDLGDGGPTIFATGASWQPIATRHPGTCVIKIAVPTSDIEAAFAEPPIILGKAVDE